jgi:hypothetical protein
MAGIPANQHTSIQHLRIGEVPTCAPVRRVQVEMNAILAARDTAGRIKVIMWGSSSISPFRGSWSNVIRRSHIAFHPSVTEFSRRIPQFILGKVGTIRDRVDKRLPRGGGAFS